MSQYHIEIGDRITGRKKKSALLKKGAKGVMHRISQLNVQANLKVHLGDLCVYICVCAEPMSLELMLLTCVHDSCVRGYVRVMCVHECVCISGLVAVCALTQRVL